MTTLLLHHPAFQDHITPPGHPERVERLRALHEALDAEAFAELEREEAPLGGAELAERVHGTDHVASIHSAIPESGYFRIDPDTIVSPGSFTAALHGIGAATRSVDAVFTGEADNVFAAIRPPGHHAETATAMGFCLFNNVAIAARHAQDAHGAEKIAIVDFDVHHGNGSQEIFWADPSVLYASTHQMPLFPGTGAYTETGAGNIFNAPLSPGDDSAVFREAFGDRILPALNDFKPDLVLVSAGFDAHRDDPLAQILLTGEDFAWVSGHLMDVADRYCNGRLASFLEGGYSLDGLAEGAVAHIRQLMQAG